MKHTGILLLVVFLHFKALSVPDSSFRPSIQTAYFHIKLDEIQQNFLLVYGIGYPDSSLRTSDSLYAVEIIRAAEQIDSIQRFIEFSKVNTNEKVRYLRGFSELLSAYKRLQFQKKMSWLQLPSVTSLFGKAVALETEGMSILPVVEQYPYAESGLLLKNMAFETNPGMLASKEYVFLKMLQDRPDEILKELLRNDSYSYTDSLILIAARRVPEDVFTGAQAKYTSLGQKIIALSGRDSMLALVVELANMRTGQMFLPFLHLIYNGQLSIDTINYALKSPGRYYKLLVQTQVMYAAMQAAGNRLAGARSLAAMLKQKSAELYVTPINGLHELPAATRFKSIQRLSPQELYYLVVMNEETIYTSSYIYVYNRIFEKLPVKNSDTLLQLVHFDRYKKFITMAANYNKLDDFLSRMSEERSTDIMTGFVNNLNKGQNENDIEDAVDVSNAFASITQPAIRSLMMAQVNKNCSEASIGGNKRAYNIYRIEKLIMESSDTVNHIQLSDSLGIPAVYDVRNNYLADSLGSMIM